MKPYSRIKLFLSEYVRIIYGIMSNQSCILYIEKDEHELESLAELLEQEKIRVFKARSIKDARETLTKETVHLILIDVNMSSDNENDVSGLEIVNDSTYNSIPKIVIIIQDIGLPLSDNHVYNRVEDNSLVIDFVNKQDPLRLEKLITTLKEYLA